jgi:hypothetical protein
MLKVTDNQFNLSPRKEFCGAKVGSDSPAINREVYN